MIENQQKAVLKLNDVSLRYSSRKSTFEHGVHQVLNRVSMQLYEGETLGVIGNNGCGKTTILRIMAGILAPSSGKIWRQKGSSTALLSLGLGFKPNLSGRSNAILAAMLQGANRAQAESYLEDIKDFSELGDSFEEPVKTYSNGMRSRLGFTTALKTHVDILLIDEVLSVGDAQFKGKAESALKERIAGDQTVVFVSHAPNQIKELCNRAIWLNEGSIAGEGDASEVMESYLAHIKSNTDARARRQSA